MKLRRVVIVLLAVALLAAVTLNVVLYQRSRGFYRQLNEIKLDPLGLSHYPAGADGLPPLESGQTRVVFFGDSRAEDWPSPSGLEQFQFVNRGIGNQTTAQIVERFDEHIAPLDPDIVVIQAGINDLKTIPLFPEQKAAIVANCQANVERLVTQSLDLGAIVVLTTVFPLGQAPLERRLVWSDDVAAAIDEVNEFIATLAGERVVILDAAAILADERGVVQQAYSRDLLHLAESGYDALNTELAPVLAEVKPEHE